MQRDGDENYTLEYKIRSSKGEEMLGGSLWDIEVEKEMLLQCSQQTNRSEEDIRKSVADYTLIKCTSEEYKIQLSSGSLDTTFVLRSTGDLVNFRFSIEDFEKKTEHLLLKALGVFDNALESAYNSEVEGLQKITKDDIYKIILVGGGSRMPQIKKGMIARHPDFADKILMRDPDLSISKGAAIWCKEYNETILTERLSNTFGISAYPNDEDEDIVCCNHIHIGQSIPCECTLDYLTRYECTALHQNIYQNASSIGTKYTSLDECDKIGTLIVQLPHTVPKDTPIKTTLKVDSSGILSVISECIGVTNSCTITLTPELEESLPIDLILRVK